MVSIFNILRMDIWPAAVPKRDATELPGKGTIESETEIQDFRALHQNVRKKTP